LDLKPHPGAAKVEFEPSQKDLKRLHEILDAFNLGREPAVLAEAFTLAGPGRHGDDMAASDLVTRLSSGYQWLSDTYGERGWWQANGPQIIAELEQAWTDSAVRRPGPPTAG
jgi:hypothetical protein